MIIEVTAAAWQEIGLLGDCGVNCFSTEGAGSQAA